MCVASLAVSVAHLCYVAIVTPYRKRLEQWLSGINAVIVVLIAVCAVWSRLSHDADDGRGTPTLALGYSLLAANGYFFVQLIVLSVSAVVHECRREKSDAGIVACNSNLPLLAVPADVPLTGLPMTPGAQQSRTDGIAVAVANPLAIVDPSRHATKRSDAQHYSEGTTSGGDPALLDVGL